MKKFVLVNCIIVSFCNSIFSTAVISGVIDNPDNLVVRLFYDGGHLAMSPEYYIRNGLIDTLDEQNRFTFRFETTGEYCRFRLVYDNAGYSVYVKDNDSIHIRFDASKDDETFIASGCGNALTNFFFVYERFVMSYPPDSITDEGAMLHAESQKSSFLNLLKSFQQGKLLNPESYPVDQQTLFHKLISASELSRYDYKLLKNLSNYLISEAIYFTSYDYQLSHLDDFISMLEKVDFHRNLITHDLRISKLVDDYVRFSSYHDYCKERNDSLSISAAFKYFSVRKFAKAKEILTGELLQKFVADELYHMLLFGKYDNIESYYDQACNVLTDTIYSSVINRFYANYRFAYDDNEFNLSSPTRFLNDATLKELLHGLKGQKVYVILWKIDKRTSYSLTPLSQLDRLNKLKTSPVNRNIRFIDICLANLNSRQHWASLIAQYHWQGDHYFVSDQYEEAFRRFFNCTDRMNYCSAELYFLYDEEGRVLIDNDSDMILF